MKMNDADRWPQLDFAVNYIKEHGQDEKLSFLYEFGVGSGRSTKKLLKLCEKAGLRINGYKGYDSFKGLPEEALGVPVNPGYLSGSYKFTANAARTRLKLAKVPVEITKINFEDLSGLTGEFAPALIAHVDSDLYISAKHVLTFLVKNKILLPGSILCFDEFQSVTPMYSGGEAKAYREVLRWQSFREVFRSCYVDKTTGQNMMQNAFLMLPPGDSSEEGYPSC